MATKRKVKRYDLGGATGDVSNDDSMGMAPPPDQGMNEAEPSSNFSTPPYDPGMQEAEPSINYSPTPSVSTAPATPPRAIVSKKQLAESVYDNLRDYLNAQKGIPRKGEKEPRKPTASPAKSEGKKQPQAAPVKTNFNPDKLPSTRPKDEPGLENVYPEQMLGGGAGFGLKAIANLAKGLAARQAAKEIAKETLPAVADKITPLKFLGKSGRRVVGAEELPNPQLKLGMKRGGKVKHKPATKHTEHKPKGGRGDGIATKGFTKGRYL
jgi:hypothetical protein